MSCYLSLCLCPRRVYVASSSPKRSVGSLVAGKPKPSLRASHESPLQIAIAASGSRLQGGSWCLALKRLSPTDAASRLKDDRLPFLPLISRSPFHSCSLITFLIMSNPWKASAGTIFTTSSVVVLAIISLTVTFFRRLFTPRETASSVTWRYSHSPCRLLCCNSLTYPNGRLRDLVCIRKAIHAITRATMQLPLR